MKIVIGNFKKVFNEEETQKVLNEYENLITGDKVYFCVIPECCELKSKFKLFSQHKDSCGRVLLGHSDFKMCFNLSDKDVAINAKENLKLGTDVILCVGESNEQKENGQTKKTLKNQLRGLKKFMGDKLIIVYEPIFALGQASLPNLDYICENITFIKKLLPKCKVVYGGSVDEKNAKIILGCNIIDGVFLHRASLFKEKMEQIVNLAKNY